jgi:hypothetical protein
MENEPSEQLLGDGEKSEFRGIKFQGLVATPASQSGIEIELLRKCLFRLLDKVRPDDLSRANSLQGMFQQQCRRILAKDGQLEADAARDRVGYTPFTPDERRNLVYVGNCRPVCFGVKKQTDFCFRPLFCPWCYVRQRLLSAFHWLAGGPTEIATSHFLLTWERRLLDITADPTQLFFSRQRGPHNTFKAYRHLQTAIVGFKPDSGFHWRVIGMAVVPREQFPGLGDKITKMYPKLAARMFAAREGEILDSTQIVSSFVRYLTFPVTTLLAPKGLETAMFLYRQKDRSKLFRKGGN